MTFADRVAVVEVGNGPAFELADTRRAWGRQVRLAALLAVGGLTGFVICIVVWQPDSAASVPNAFAMVGWLTGLSALLLGAVSSLAWSEGGWAVVSTPGGENLILARLPRVPLVTRLIGRRVARARSART
jgi:hypothetical protein